MKVEPKKNIEIRCLCCGKLLAVGSMPDGIVELSCNRCSTTNTFITRPKSITDLDVYLKQKNFI